MKSFKTKAEVKYQQWLLRTIYPKLNDLSLDDEYLEEFREFLVKLCRRAQVDFFSDGKSIASTHEIFFRLRHRFYPYQLEPAFLPQDSKLSLFAPLVDPSLINRYVQFTVPRCLKTIAKRFTDEDAIVCSIGYGQGNLEWTLLNQERVEAVHGIEFIQGKNEQENLKKYLEDCVSWHEKLAKQEKKKVSIKDRLRLYLDQYFAKDSSLTIEQIHTDCKYLYDMIDTAPDFVLKNFSKITSIYNIRMDAIAGIEREHRLFSKKKIDISKLTIDEICREITQVMKNEDADIVLLKDSLHHSPNPYKYLKTVFEALKEGSYLIVIEPYMYDDDSLGASLLRTAFETTQYPKSIYTLRKHEKWINTFLLYGATIEGHEMHTGISDFNINYDPFHRFEICLKKQKLIAGEIPEFLHKEPSTEEIDEAVKCVNDSKFIAQGTCYEDDANALVKNRLWLSGISKEHSLAEVPYFQLFNHEYYERSKEREKRSKESLERLMFKINLKNERHKLK